MAESSDLAIFVASLLRDEVVFEQNEIIQKLKEQLDASRRVEVTGKGGYPVYARGSIQEGDFNTAHSDFGHENRSVLWDVGLKMVSSSHGNANEAIPLCCLSEIEIRVGGILYATSAQVKNTGVALGIRPGNKFDGGDMSRSVVCQFGSDDSDEDSSAGFCFMTFHVRGLDYGHWRSLRSTAMFNASIAMRRQQETADEEDSDEYVSDIYKLLCKSYPSQTAGITSISFCARDIRQAIENLDRGIEFENEKKKQFSLLDREWIFGECFGSV